MLHTTFRKLHKEGACAPSYLKLAKTLGGIRKYGKDTPIPLDKVLESNGLDDALWCLRCINESAGMEIILFKCDCAERVLPIFEKEYPDDNRPRILIETLRRFANKEATQEELARAARAARESRAAAWDAREAANAAVWATTGDARAVAMAAWAAGDWGRAEREWQTQRFIKLLEECG